MAFQWRFDRQPASGSDTGFDVASLLMSRGLDGLVRETLQNANDQQLDPDAPVVVTYRLEVRTGDEKKRFLEALSWDSLGRHVEEAAKQGGRTDTTVRLSDSAARLNGKDALLTLAVEDSGTKGLTGDEYEKGSNYKALVKDVAVQGDVAAKRGRGGSWGLGKAAGLSASGISTVLFSSVVPKPGTDPATAPVLRLTGRTVLPSHDLDGTPHSGLGWLGAEGGSPFDTHAVVSRSAWGAEAQDPARALGIERAHAGRGATVLVVDFHDVADARFERRRDADLEGIVADICLSAAMNFWPAILEGRLQVSVELWKNSRQVMKERVDPQANAELAPFLKAYADRSNGLASAKADGEIASRTFDLEIPPAADGSASGVTAENRVAVMRSEDGVEHTLRDRIALVRGSGMVINYYRTGHRVEELPYFGVCVVGLGAAANAPASAAEDFFTDAEPPSHEDWVATNQTKVAKNYGEKAAKETLESFFEQLRSSVRSMCPIPEQPGEGGPVDLAPRFRGLEGDDPPEKRVQRDISVVFPDPYPEPNWTARTLVLSGMTIRLAPAKKTADPAPRSWGFIVKAGAQSEGRTEPLECKVVACSGGKADGAAAFKGIPVREEVTVTVHVDLGGTPEDVPIEVTCAPRNIVFPKKKAAKS